MPLDKPNPTTCSLAARAPFAPTTPGLLWRVQTGALRIDSAQSGEPSRFMRLALPGDVLGVEQWVGSEETLSLRALTPVTLQALDVASAAVMPILMETVVIAHQRCREVVSLRTGPVSQRVKCLLLMFADSVNPDAKTTADCVLPHLSDLADMLDAAPETVSRVFSSMRRLDYLQDRKPQKARFDRLALRTQNLLPGMSAGAFAPRSQLVGV